MTEDYYDDGDLDPGQLLALIRTGAELNARTFPPLAYVVPGIVPEGLTLLVAPPKAGKSWWVLAMLLAVAAGGSAFGVEVEARPTLYLALEDGPRRLKDRCEQLLGEPDAIPVGFHYITDVMPTPALLALVRAWAEQHPRGVVVIDTLGKMQPPARAGETTYSRDYRIAGDIKRIADQHPGLSVLVNHHDRKAGAEDFVDSVSGTHGLAGAADTILALKRPRGSQSAVLHVTGRDVSEAEYAMVLDDGYRWRLDGEGLADARHRAATIRAQSGLGDLSARVAGYVTGAAGREVGAAEIAEALDEDRGKVDRYLARLVDSGRLVRAARGLYRSLDPLSYVSEVSEASTGQDTSDTSDTPTEGDTLALVVDRLGAVVLDDDPPRPPDTCAVEACPARPRRGCWTCAEHMDDELTHRPREALL